MSICKRWKVWTYLLIIYHRSIWPSCLPLLRSWISLGTNYHRSIWPSCLPVLSSSISDGTHLSWCIFLLWFVNKWSLISKPSRNKTTHRWTSYINWLNFIAISKQLRWLEKAKKWSWRLHSKDDYMKQITIIMSI